MNNRITEFNLVIWNNFEDSEKGSRNRQTVKSVNLTSFIRFVNIVIHYNKYTVNSQLCAIDVFMKIWEDMRSGG